MTEKEKQAMRLNLGQDIEVMNNQMNEKEKQINSVEEQMTLIKDHVL